MTAKIGNFVEQEPIMFQQSLFEESSTKKHRLGTIRRLEDGRVFVYAYNGAVALSAAYLVCPGYTTPTAATPDETVTVGDKDIHVTAAGVTASQFRDGWLLVTTSTGIGDLYKIRDNDATDSDGDVDIELYDSFRHAVTTTSTSKLYQNPYSGVLVNPLDAQQKPLGVPTLGITASYYFWLQCKGPGPLVMDVPAAAGLELDEKLVIASTNVAGAGMITTTPANADMRHIVGELMEEQDLTNTYAALINLNL